MAISVQAIQNGIIKGALTTYQTAKNVVMWGGHQVKVGFAYALPAIQSVWSFAIANLLKIAQMLRANPILAFSSSVALLLAGSSLIKAGQTDSIGDQPAHQTTLLALGVLSILGGSIAAGIGVSVLPLV